MHPQSSAVDYASRYHGLVRLMNAVISVVTLGEVQGLARRVLTFTEARRNCERFYGWLKESSN